MHEYLFDIPLVAAVRVKAASQDEARAMLKRAFDCADCNGGAWPNGDAITFEATLDEANLAEVDGQEIA
jgi:hypothetical protein